MQNKAQQTSIIAFYQVTLWTIIYKILHKNIISPKTHLHSV